MRARLNPGEEQAMITSLDHLVLTVRDLDATVRFYVEGLGMQLREFAEGREALHFGSQKINLHLAGHEFEPKAAHPTPGSGDLCFLTEHPLGEVSGRLQALGYPIIEGPVARSGATGPIRSVYTLDPDGNLVEIARPE
jgi:catechol 2,3-dioxygenase-like lactoylglutathione lyase family enzyme